MDDKPLPKGCWIAIVVIVLAILVGGGFGIHSLSTTRRVAPGSYGVVIYYHNNGAKDVQVYDAGTQYYVDWGSNVKEWSYPSSTQTIKIYRSTTEGIAPYADDISCHDINGVAFSGDLQAHFDVLKSDVYTVYSQHPGTDLNGSVDNSIAGLVVRPILQEAWRSACSLRTYTDFQAQEYISVQTAIFNYAAPKLKAQGVTLIDVGPQTVYLPQALQDSINAIAKANSDLVASKIAVQAAQNQAQALEEYRQEIEKDPALLKLLIIQQVLAKWDGHGVLPSYITNP